MSSPVQKSLSSSPNKAGYGSLDDVEQPSPSDGTQPLDEEEDEYEDDDDQVGDGFVRGWHRSYSQRARNEGFTPLYRHVSEGFAPLYRRVSEAFPPLYRTVSEGVQTLSRPTFSLSESALDLDEDRRGKAARRLGTAGTSNIPSEVANMSKNTIGGGVMSLSGGIALYASNYDPAQSALVSAIAWIIGLGVLFGYFCLLTGKSCERSLSATYRECWERTVGGGSSGCCRGGGLLVAIVTTLDPFLCLFVNSAILSQSLQFSLKGLLGIHWSIPDCLIFIAIVALLPLCLMGNLDALAPFSVVGMAAVLATLGCMVIRYVDGSYSPGGSYYDEIFVPEEEPSFASTYNTPWSSFIAMMPFVCRVFTSFDMHYNSPRYYTELKDATVPRLAQVCTYSFAIVSCLYLIIAVVGFLTFGESSKSYILNNYSPTDPVATVARLSMGFSAMLTYPLNFMGLRDNLLDLLGLADYFKTAKAKMRVFVVLLLIMCITMACFVTDLGLISSVGGGTTVALVAFVFPAIMFWQAIRPHPLHDNNTTKPTVSETVEAWFAMVSMIAMVLLGILGVVSSIVLDA